MTSLRRLFSRFRRAQDGAATVEFVLIFPVFMLILASTYEIGMANVRHVMLERGTDIAVRQIRLNTGAPPTKDQVRRMVCNVAGIIPDCMNALEIELRRVDKTTWNMPPRQASCVDRDETIQPVVAYENGLQNEMMMMRFCAVVDPMFPSYGLGYTMPKDPTGGYRLVSITAFVNEPL